MSKRAEEAALKVCPPMIVKDEDGSLDDLTYMARTWVQKGYEQAEQDLALTAEDVGCIYNLVLQMQVKYNATSACYQEVADIFNKDREEEQK